ncbi:uncharacterized protein KY384_002666 [Bacidia gigantensis]|uniref:uncharacterized protein n=1 Tax=Bacidia gigantensis TaxID=2732470 RepID=UPI001D04AD77|nr:uncharacterized protein KY384_002666 [Bacidia gigantensis]KAG8532788.1 hypothetical protein KY384_002666 [Bacidia gigantensis]
MATINMLDSRELPPERVKKLFKQYRKSHHWSETGASANLIDTHSLPTSGINATVSLESVISSEIIAAACKDLIAPLHSNGGKPVNCEGARVFAVEGLPELFYPFDQDNHRAFNTSQFLNSKLRWMTLGGQYDWTEKRYPPEDPPPFPKEIDLFIKTLFPNVRPEAAIMNIYNPGDSLSMHRDVSEQCDNALVSISLGCDALFIAALQPDSESEPKHKVFRLHSGDAIYLDGPSRFAWHGVPKVIPKTCPDWLHDWPAESTLRTDDYSGWRGWMAGKRINLSVRQMHVEVPSNEKKA